MRILLDEQLPRQLAPYLVGHDARTVQQESWAGFKNGALLTQAEAAGFSVFLTGDQSLEFQQNISKRHLGVVVVRLGWPGLSRRAPGPPSPHLLEQLPGETGELGAGLGHGGELQLVLPVAGRERDPPPSQRG